MPLEAVEARRLYRQVADQLRALIDSGEYRVGSRLPTERDLAEQLKVSRPTVREALIALEVEGRVRIRVGSGIYVSEPAALAPLLPATGNLGSARASHALFRRPRRKLCKPVLLIKSAIARARSPACEARALPGLPRDR